MSIQSQIVTALAAVAGGRVYPQAAPQDAAKPFVVYRTAASEPVMTVHGYAGLTRSQFVFDCWAGTALSALDTADAVRVALEIPTLTWVRETAPENGYSPESDEFSESVTYSFWHS